MAEPEQFREMLSERREQVETFLAGLEGLVADTEGLARAWARLQKIKPGFTRHARVINPLRLDPAEMTLGVRRWAETVAPRLRRWLEENPL